MKTTAQRISDAMDRLDEAVVDLLAAAELWKASDTPAWNLRANRKELFRNARNYARCMNALTRLRKSS